MVSVTSTTNFVVFSNDLSATTKSSRASSCANTEFNTRILETYSVSIIRVTDHIQLSIDTADYPRGFRISYFPWKI